MDREQLIKLCIIGAYNVLFTDHSYGNLLEAINSLTMAQKVAILRHHKGVHKGLRREIKVALKSL